jgi:hypothetical protein
MDQWIELMGSIVIAGYIIFIILTLNSRISSTTFQYFQNSFNERNAVTVGQVIEYDFYKIGYKTSGNKILYADSSMIQFVSDLDNAGNSDTVTYSLSDTSALTNTTNPNDKILYRKRNQTKNITGIVTRFYLQYYDSLLNNLTYASLTNQTNRTNIRVIRAYIRTEFAAKADSSYYPMEWQKEFKPRNMR